jgi:hypothetical protein
VSFAKASELGFILAQTFFYYVVKTNLFLLCIINGNIGLLQHLKIYGKIHSQNIKKNLRKHLKVHPLQLLDLPGM